MIHYYFHNLMIIDKNIVVAKAADKTPMKCKRFITIKSNNCYFAFPNHIISFYNNIDV